MATIYYPTLTSVLAWVSARFTCVLLGWDIAGGASLAIAGFYLICAYCLNALSPVLAGKFQVSATVIKLIPLALMAVVGTAIGLTSGMTAQNFSHVVDETVGAGSGLFASVVSVAFAYEGWIVATSINAELKDSKKNLPRALIIGSFIVVAAYILYYVGLAGAVTTEALMENGQAGARLAFTTILGPAGGTLIFVFIIISCLGTLNGLMLGCTRGIYSLAVRGEGLKPQLFSQVDTCTNMPLCSSIVGLLFCGGWLLYFFGAQLADPTWFGPFCFDSSELPIITLYAFYAPIFFTILVKEKDLPAFKRFVMPMLALLGCVFMVAAALISHTTEVFYYLIIFAVIMLISLFFRKSKKTLSQIASASWTPA